MRAAFEVVVAVTEAFQPSPGRVYVRRLALVAGAGQGQFPVADAEGIGRTALDQRQRLQGLDGRARIDVALQVAGRVHDVAFDIDHGEGAAVAALDHLPAGHLDQHGVLRALRLALAVRLFDGLLVGLIDGLGFHGSTARRQGVVRHDLILPKSHKRQGAGEPGRAQPGLPLRDGDDSSPL